MRGPSARILKQTCSIHAATSAQDGGGGHRPTYAAAPTSAGVPCSAQPNGFAEVWDQGQLSVHVSWRLFFATPVLVRPRDMIVFRDDAGITHTVYAEASRDEAGRGGCYSIRATERT